MAWLRAHSREKVERRPTADLEKCLKCGMRMNCGKEVFHWTEHGKLSATQRRAATW